VGVDEGGVGVSVSKADGGDDFDMTTSSLVINGLSIGVQLWQ
jgi:hypothetical protein